MNNPVLSLQAGAVRKPQARNPRPRQVREATRLKWVNLVEKPRFVQRGRGTASMLEGKRYEKQFGKWLVARYGEDSVAHEPWFEFEDSKGYGIAAPDYLVFLGGVVVIFECKLTNNAEATAKLRGLYRPLVEFKFNTPTSMVVVCRNLRLGDEPDTWLAWEDTCDPKAATPLLQHWRP